MDADTQLEEPVTTQKREDGEITVLSDTVKQSLRKKKSQADVTNC